MGGFKTNVKTIKLKTKLKVHQWKTMERREREHN